MAAYKRHVYGNPAPLKTDAPRAPVGGGRPALRQKVNSLHNDADKVLGHGMPLRRVSGLRGSSSWRFPSTSNEGPSKTHPETGHELECWRGSIRMNPGYQLRAIGMFLPGGGQQTDNGLGGWTNDGAGGHVEIEVTYNNRDGGSSSLTRFLKPKPSVWDYGAEPSQAGASWSLIEHLETVLTPVAYPVDMETQRLLGDECVAEVVVKLIGAVRCVDLVIVEEPRFAAVKQGTEELDKYPTLMHTGPNGLPLKTYPRTIPVAQLSDIGSGDRSGGPLVALQAARYQPTHCGPAIWTWSAYNEAEIDFDADEADPVSVSSSSWTNLSNGVVHSWDAAKPGGSISSAGLSRRWYESSPLSMDDRIAAIPVRVSVWGCTSGVLTEGYVRVSTGDHSHVDVRISPTEGTNVLSEAWGCLSAPLNGDLDSVLQAFARVAGGGGSIDILSVTVSFADRPD